MIYISLSITTISNGLNRRIFYTHQKNFLQCVHITETAQPLENSFKKLIERIGRTCSALKAIAQYTPENQLHLIV